MPVKKVEIEKRVSNFSDDFLREKRIKMRARSTAPLLNVEDIRIIDEEVLAEFPTGKLIQYTVEVEGEKIGE